MNYQLHYERLIQAAKSKNRRKGQGECYERHHIKPRSIGGDNASANLVLLTPKEHFVAHHLLMKAKPELVKLKRAFWMMCQSAKRDGFSHASAYVYEATRTQIANTFRHSDETRAIIAVTSTGRLHSAEAKEKISRAHSGKYVSEEVRKKISAKRRVTKLTEEWKQNIRLAKLGKPKSPEHKEKLRLASLGKKSHRFGLKWFTDGARSLMTSACPEGFFPGRTLAKGD